MSLNARNLSPLNTEFVPFEHGICPFKHGICPFSQAETRTSIGCECSEKVFKSLKSLKSIGAGYPQPTGTPISKTESDRHQDTDR